MIITNPASESLEIQYKGVSYKVEANSTLKGVPDEAAEYWQKELHNFIEVSEEGKAKIVKEEKEEEEEKAEVKKK